MFHRNLKKRGIDWPQTVEAGSLDLVTRYVANGDGVGVREFVLDEFEPVSVGAIWSRPLSPQAEELVESLRIFARQIWPEAAGR